MNTELSNETKKQIIQSFHNWRNEMGTNGEPLSLSKIKTMSASNHGQVELPISYLSDILNGKLTTGSKETQISDKYFRSVASLISFDFGMEVRHFETENYKKMHIAYDNALKTGLPVCIDGPTRYGKSYTAEQYKKRSKQSQYIYGIKVAKDLTHKGFMEELALSIGLIPNGSAYKIRKTIGDKIKKNAMPCLLIIDESENMNDNSFGSAKAIMDDLKGIMGIAFNGANNFENKLRTKANKNKGCFPQIVGRFEEGLGFVQLEDYGTNRPELIDICKSMGIKSAKLQNKFIDSSKSIGVLIRNIEKTVSLAQELEIEIDEKLVNSQIL